MASRPSVPINVERALWAESMGFCMNPACAIELIGTASVAEKAHIVPHADGGPPSFDNLLLLCRNCHAEIDATRSDQTEQKLRNWKRNRNLDIRLRYSQRYANFWELEAAIVPLMERNGDVYREYGPETQSEDLHDLWVQFEPELIANNAKILSLLKVNGRLLHPGNQTIVNTFERHVREFNNTRDSYRGMRSSLFPEQLSSVFGVQAAREPRPVSNLSALQNFVRYLVEQSKFVKISFEPEPLLTYISDDDQEDLYLDDEPRLTQLYWAGGFYRPKNTELRVETLVFLANWLANNRIGYSINDPTNLVEWTLNDKYNLVLTYEYCLTIATLYEIPLSANLVVVNLYNWNRGCITDQARAYAAENGFRAFTQREFFRFAHSRLK